MTSTMGARRAFCKLWRRRHHPLGHPLTLTSKFPLEKSRCLSASSTSPTTTSTSLPDAIELHYDWVDPRQNNGDDPHDHVILFLHGLLGNGRNLRTMAKKVCQASQQPGLLVDIRGHGQSKILAPHHPKVAPTTTFASCVRDLHHTLQNIPQVTQDTTLTLVGHSLGGRLSLQYAHDAMFHPTSTTTRNKLRRVWLLDTVPGQANDSVERVVAAVTQLASSASGISNRQELVKQLTNDPYKIDMGTAQWLASSLQVPPNHNHNHKDATAQQASLEFSFDLAVVHDLLADFHNQRFMDLLERIVSSDDNNNKNNHNHNKKVRVDLVRGGTNQGWNETQHVGPLRALENQYPNQFGMHLLDKAGHWVHVDDLPGLLKIMDVSEPS